MQWKLTVSKMVSKRLCKEIQYFVESGLQGVQIKWESEIHRHSFVEVCEDFLLDLYDEGKINQGKVVCDDRNNKPIDFTNGKFVLEVHFKEKNSLITTKLLYNVEPEK